VKQFKKEVLQLSQ